MITLCIALAFECCWITEAEFHKEIEEMGEIGMRRALQLALDEASCAQTAVFVNPSPEVIEHIKRCLTAERN